MSFLRSFGALSGASFVSMAANLVRGKLAAVFLGPAGVGAYNQLTLSYNVATLVGSLASNNGVIQHGSQTLGADDRKAFAELASTMAIALAVSSIFVGVAAILFSPWISDLLLSDGGSHGREVGYLMIAVPIMVFATLYRGLLGADQAVRDLVRVQIYSEVGGMILFAALLLLEFGLPGALVGYLSVQVIALLYSFAALRRRFGSDLMMPRFNRFRWQILRSNLAFGASGFIMVGLSNLALIGVNRIVIGAMGLAAAGLLANAFRLSNVYLGAVTASALNYYLPAVTRLTDPKEVSAEVNRVVRFYCLLLPPIMVAIIALAPWIVRVIFSKAFLAAVPLIIVLVPSEFFRIIGETLTIPLIGKRRLVAHTALFGLQTMLFVGLAIYLVPTLGLMGAAVAYSVAVLVYCLASLICVRRLLAVCLDGRSGLTVLGTTVLLVITSSAALILTPVQVVAVAAVAGIAWVGVMFRDPAVRDMLERLRQRPTND